MHTLRVISKLGGVDAVGFHVIGVGMAVCAGSGDVRGVHFRAQVRGTPEIMNAVAIGADRNLCIALGPFDAVHTGFVLLELIDAQAWIVFLHARGISVTRGAEFRDLPARDLAFPSPGTAHGLVWIVAVWVPSM